MNPPDAVPTAVACVSSPEEVASRFRDIPGLFGNASVSRRLYSLVEEAVRDKARGRGGNFHTARCHLRQLRDSRRRSDIVLCPRLTADEMTAAYIQHTMDLSSADLEAHSACVLTVTVAFPPPVRQNLRLIMWAPLPEAMSAAPPPRIPTAPVISRDAIPDPTKCLFCKADAPANTCSRCRLARYCGTACQRAHWKHHKTVCRTSEGHGSAVATAAPSITIVAGPVPRTEDERQASLRRLNLQGDPSGVTFHDMADSALPPMDGEALKELMEQMGAVSFELVQEES